SPELAQAALSCSVTLSSMPASPLLPPGPRSQMPPSTPQPSAGGPEGFVPSPADRAASYQAAGYWTGRTLDTILTDAAQRWPDRIAVIDALADGGLSYAELDEGARRAPARRRALGK